MPLRVRRTLTTSASPAAAFAFLADFRNTETWDPGTVVCELVSGSAGEVGATYRNVSELLGRKTEFAFSGLSRLVVPVVAAYLPFLAATTPKQLKASLDAL